MTTNIVRDQIFNFLNCSSPEVMAINGAWGAGKTFSWNKFLLEAKEEKGIQLDKYSYVSLFGINSLEALKYAIFENTVQRDIIGASVSIETFKANASGLGKLLGKKVLGLINQTSLMNGYSPALDAMSFLSVNKTIICIDDLERAGKNLNLRDVLGLVSLLKEQKECKIAILLNDGEKDLEDYFKYREKVVDFELVFSPTAQECASIAFDGGRSRSRYT